MQLNQKEILTLSAARRAIRRAVDKAEELKQRGSFVVVNESGVVVSASRMDGSGAFGLPLSRAKAYIAAINRETSATIYDRVSSRYLGIFLGYQDDPLIRFHSVL